MRFRAIFVVVACALVAAGAVVPRAQAAAGDDGIGAAGAPTRAYHKVLLPTRAHARSNQVPDVSAQALANGSGPLAYGGGANGVTVVTGTPRVYLVFWGSQWGANGFDVAGRVTFAGDTAGLAPRLQQFFAGLGTDGEGWSAVSTQYCEGVPFGATSCPTDVRHVGYPYGGALAAVWADTSVPAPTQATDEQLALEATAAAAHFGNLTAADNRNAQYFVVSPSGTLPGGFRTPSGTFCAWHASVQSTAGDLAFTNFPYVTDAGAACGRNYVHAGAAGTLDGVTIVAGHEFAETVTDPLPPTGWIDAAGYENADKCQWIGTGGAGGAQDVTFATGTFPVMGLWSNTDSACVVSGPLVVGAAPVRITAVGASLTESLMDQVFAADAPGAFNLHARLFAQVVVPADASCGPMVFGPGALLAPPDATAGLAALGASTAGTYPDTVTGAGGGCVDIARSDVGPGG